MEYTEIAQPLALIFVTFFTGIICGAVWMFSTLEKHYNQFKI